MSKGDAIRSHLFPRYFLGIAGISYVEAFIFMEASLFKLSKTNS
jgi:hypothetical protein